MTALSSVVAGLTFPALSLLSVSVTAGSKDCESYRDVSNSYQSFQKCYTGFCCGSCFNRYCCRDSFWRLTEDKQEEWYSVLFYLVIDEKWSVTAVDTVMQECGIRRVLLQPVMQRLCSQATGCSVFLWTTTSTKLRLCVNQLQLAAEVSFHTTDL